MPASTARAVAVVSPVARPPTVPWALRSAGADGGADQAQEGLAGGAGAGGGVEGVGGGVTDLATQRHGDLADEDPGGSVSCGQSHPHLRVLRRGGGRWSARGGGFTVGHGGSRLSVGVGGLGERLVEADVAVAGQV